MATTAKLSFPSGATVFVQAFSNAAFSQAVTIQPPSNQSPSTTSAVFEGSGESNALQTLTTQGFLTPNSGGQPSFVVPDGGGEYTISVTGDGTSSQVLSDTNTVQTPDNGQILIGWVSSEDADDHDWNDSVVVFTSFLPAAARARRTA